MLKALLQLNIVREEKLVSLKLPFALRCFSLSLILSVLSLVFPLVRCH